METAVKWNVFVFVSLRKGRAVLKWVEWKWETGEENLRTERSGMVGQYNIFSRTLFFFYLCIGGSHAKVPQEF